MTRKRASIKGIGASIFCSADDDPEPANVRSQAETEKSVATPCADRPIKDGCPPAAPEHSEPEPAPLRIRAERQPLPRPRLHIVPPVQMTPAEPADTPAPLAHSEPAATPVLAEAPSPAQSSTGAPAQTAVDAAEPVPAESAPLERAPDGGPEAPTTPPEPISPVMSVDAPSEDLKATTPEQESTAHGRLGDAAPKAMLDEISVLYERVTNTSGVHMEMAERAMDLLSAARDLLLLGNAGDFNLAERKVNEAKLILNRIDQSSRWSNTYGWGLLLYELIAFTGLVAAIIFDWSLAQWFGGLTGSGAATPSMSVIFAPWSTMLWGGIGGVVGALYSLHWHVAELQDFDWQFTFWYIVQPVMGLILGGIIHLVIVSGMLALVPVNGASDGARVAAAAVNWFPSLLACLAGFRQKFAYELMDNIMKVVGRQPASTAKSNV